MVGLVLITTGTWLQQVRVPGKLLLKRQLGVGTDRRNAFCMRNSVAQPVARLSQR